MESKKFYINVQSKRSFTSGIHSSLKRADVTENADIIYLTCDAYR